jgi:hypothetical protein
MTTNTTATIKEEQQNKYRYDDKKLNETTVTDTLYNGY